MNAIDDIDKAKEALGAAMASLLMRGENETAARCARAALSLSNAQDLINRLEMLCSSCYAGLGAEFNLPERFLDALSDPLNTTDAQIEALLPVGRDEGTDRTGYFEDTPLPTTTTAPPEPVWKEGANSWDFPEWFETTPPVGGGGPNSQPNKQPPQLSSPPPAGSPYIPLDVPISQIKFDEYRPGDFVREGQVWRVRIDGRPLLSKIYFMHQIDKDSK